MKKIIIGIIISLLVFLIFVLKVNMKNMKLSNAKNSADMIQFNEKKDVAEIGILNGELITRLTKKNGNWDGIPLSDNFLNKFNEKDGVLGKIEYDKFEYCPYLGADFTFSEYEYFVLTQGKKKTAYMYDYENVWTNDGEKIDDFYIDEIILLTDENGNPEDSRIVMREDNYEQLVRWLARGGDDEKSVAVTSHFHKKHPYFLDLFIHYSPIYYNRIEFIEEKSSWDKKEAYFIVDSTLECKKRYYLVEFKLDDKGYLDDAIVHKVNEEEYEGNSEWITNKIIFKNSNWHNLNLSDDFKNKYNPLNGVFPSINDLDINSIIDGRSLYENNKKDYIYSFVFRNSLKVFYHTILLYDEDNKLDDIKFEKLPYTKMSIEEAKEAYLKEHPIE